MTGERDFARKLDLVLKTCNLSRGRLAQSLGVDKSVISRWASGTTVPSDHNLSRLTEVIAHHKADFGRIDWDFDLTRFAARLGLSPAADGGEVGPAVSAVRPPEGPSIAVLPFTNFGGDPEHEYFADGITEDVITALSKWRSFVVIARNSTFTYKGRAVDVRQVGRDLNVRYVLEGSVRRASGRVRITAQLVETGAGAHLWADHFDAQLDDVFDLQDSICTSIVTALDPQVQLAELQRIRHRRPGTLTAYDYYLQALPHIYALTREGNDEARRLLGLAVAADPAYALAHALLAECYRQRRHQGWSASFADDQRNALAAAELALKLAPDDPAVLSTASSVVTSMGSDRARGRVLIDRSLSLNANSATAWAVSGWNHSYSGNGRLAIDHFQRALRLSPVEPPGHHFHAHIHAGIASGYMSLGEWEQMIEAAEKAVHLAPGYSSHWRFFTAALGHAGRREDAARALARLLELEPTLTVDQVFRTRTNHVVGSMQTGLVDGLRKAGLPEV
ncbi:MAG TPA: helix-turn-helix domain-containing protein [Reyranella sp.]|nr:helix-turn-helix domain-containing protein [Reyranella sp.]